MTRRDRVVEAGARALCRARSEDEVEEQVNWDTLHSAYEKEAAATLDAMLDCLTENADEVRAEIYELWAAAPTEPSDMLADLIEVLREDR